MNGPLRLLLAILAMNGLLFFGWSTALLFAVVERIGDADSVSDADQPPESGTEPEESFRLRRYAG